MWLIRASGGGRGGEAADVEERDRVPEGSVGGFGGGGEGVADRGFGLLVVPGEATEDPLVDGGDLGGEVEVVHGGLGEARLLDDGAGVVVATGEDGVAHADGGGLEVDRG